MKTLVRWECEKHSHMMLSVIKMWVIWSWITRARQWGSRGDDPIRALSRGRWLLRSFSHFPFFLKSKMLYGHDSWLRLKFTTSLQKGLFLKVKGKIWNRSCSKKAGARCWALLEGLQEPDHSVVMMPFICGKLTYMFYGYVFKMLPPAGPFSLCSDHSSSRLTSYWSIAGSCWQKVMFER